MKDDRRSAEVVQSASRLVQLLEQETALLQAMKPQEVDALQERKAALVKDYEEKLRALSQARDEAPEETPTISAAARQELRLAGSALQAAVQENARMLTAAKLATDQLVHSIAAAVLEEQRIQEQYGANGQASQESKAGAPVALSINQVL